MYCSALWKQKIESYTKISLMLQRKYHKTELVHSSECVIQSTINCNEHFVTDDLIHGQVICNSVHKVYQLYNYKVFSSNSSTGHGIFLVLC